MQAGSQRRMGLAAIVAGAGLFVAQGGELVFGDDSRPLLAVLVACSAIAIVGFGVAFWEMTRLLPARAGRIGAWIGLVGAALLVVFAVQLAIAALTTGEVPENFILFLVGFLLLFVAHLVVARPLAQVVGGAWWLSLLAAFAVVVALVTNEVFVWHDLALFVFEGCWVAIGVLTLRRAALPALVPRAPA